MTHPLSDSLWQHHQWMQTQQLRSFFENDPKRALHFRAQAAGVCLDFSKQLVTEKTIELLVELAEQRGLPKAILAMFEGEIVNATENRPALHTALRSLDPTPVWVDGVNIKLSIAQALQKMEGLVEALHTQRWLGYSGKPITDVVNLGIGGSDLGPKMVVEALKPYRVAPIRCHFVSNVDSADLLGVLNQLNPKTTLFVLSSKSFSTQETLLNAHTAKAWLLADAGATADVSHHWVGITSSPEKALAWGISKELILTMGPWVGGRYSLWSSMGFPIAIATGMPAFRNLLAGAHAMDTHFRTAQLSKNLPVLMGLLSVWSVNFWECQAQAIIPYDESLKFLPAYLQQLEMESNGKSVDVLGNPLHYRSAPIIFGGVGTNGQHAFHQLFHQGTLQVPIDFIVPLSSHFPTLEHHLVLYANCLAQAQALMQGKHKADIAEELKNQGMDEKAAQTLAAHRETPGNKPSSVLTVRALTPHTLGALLALYEHKVFVQSIIWNINAFDQWGVELGKQLSVPILKKLHEEPSSEVMDSSTQCLIDRFKHCADTWVILDRDGVINEDSDAYIKSADELKPIRKSLQAIARLNQAGIPVAIASNQSGIGRGLLDENALAKIHEKLRQKLREFGGHIDAVVYCPHAPSAGCECRKPKPGLLHTLAKTLHLKIEKAIFVGDHWKDFEAARLAGCRFMMVSTGKGKQMWKEHPELAKAGVLLYPNLSEAVDALLENG